MQHTGPSSPPWGIPVNIAVPIDSESQGITPWDRLRFSSLGTYHLRCWQGVFPGIKDFFITCQSRFRTADIAWFASGKNRDGEHNHPPSSFHPSMVMLVNSSLRAKNERKALLAEVKELMFDAVCLNFFFFCLFYSFLFYFDFSVSIDQLFTRPLCMIDLPAVQQS